MERMMIGDLDEARPDHLARYHFAANWYRRHGIKGHIVDIGCGVGYGSNILADDFEQVTSVELSGDAAALYQQHFKKDNIDYRNINAFEIDQNSRFDAAVSFEFLEHIENPEDLLPLYQPLTPYIICSTPNESIRPHKKPPVNPYHFRHYTPAEFDDLLRHAGFEPIERYNQESGKKPPLRLGHGGKFMITVAKRIDGHR